MIAFVPIDSWAAFPIKVNKGNETNIICKSSNRISATLKSFPFLSYSHNKKKWIAVLLSLPGIGMLGLYNYYLGYPKTGFIQTSIYVVSLLLVYLGLIYWKSSWELGYFLGLLGLGALFAWTFVDFIRVCIGVIGPNNIEMYKPPMP